MAHVRLQSQMQLEAPHDKMCQVATLSGIQVASLVARAANGRWQPPSVRQAAHVATKLALGRTWLG
jgi:hypothetical protein